MRLDKDHHKTSNFHFLFNENFKKINLYCINIYLRMKKNNMRNLLSFQSIRLYIYTFSLFKPIKCTNNLLCAKETNEGKQIEENSQKRDNYQRFSTSSQCRFCFRSDRLKNIKKNQERNTCGFPSLQNSSVHDESDSSSIEVISDSNSRDIGISDTVHDESNSISIEVISDSNSRDIGVCDTVHDESDSSSIEVISDSNSRDSGVYDI
ncbi:hypothetical protein EDEG_01100 [Edhazardia aedis USNM 41457]|uniref:Uncharacterized protein n=1 Tax=Edhazardia aedis (strain USNM 41457) TaxID=1003232 RepID=J9DTR3_EDHAE|nr:hypothetical protein EDEG_01100 [Edhazardia aedis USNM 41457]|eukprot:EJW04687.1 hypothetical protein EDEG_01100 [Edhazardia aedis USNM 41457]